MALVIGGRAVGRLDLLPDEEVVSLLDSIFAIAKSAQDTDGERETFDFKLVYPPRENYRICRDFASFANWRGGLIIIGVGDKGEIEGMTSPLCDAHLRQVLSQKDKITSRPDYLCRPINYRGTRLVVFQIFESPKPIRVYRGGEWWTFRRYGSIPVEMTDDELAVRFYRRVGKIEDFLRLRVDSVAFYSPRNKVLGNYVEWKTPNPRSLYAMLELSYLPPVLVPTQPSILSSSELYCSTTRSYGDMKNVLAGMVELENEIQGMGIIYECWTVAADRPKMITEPHTYRTGMSATTLQGSIVELVARLGRVNFGWVIISGGITLYILAGTMSERSTSVTVTSITSFIPNRFSFFYLDEGGRAAEECLPVSVIKQPLTKRWRSSVPSTLFLDEPPEEELAKTTPATLVGYLGPKPDAGGADMPKRTKGLVVLSVEHNRRSDFEGMIPEMDPVLCNFSTLPMRFNDLEEIRVVGQKATAFLFPYYDFHDFHLILFDIDCDVNQRSAMKRTGVSWRDVEKN